MKSNKDKKLFLKQLEKIPIIQAACERSNVSRSSVYRWKNEDKQFRNKLEKALSVGETLINDLSEAQLITLIKEKNFSAIRFWLNNRHEKFSNRLHVVADIYKVQEKLSPEQEALAQKALRLASLNPKEINSKKDATNRA